MRPFMFLTLTLVVSALLHAQWIQTNGPYGGYVQLLARPSAGGVGGGTNIFIAMEEARIFRSTNGGANWSTTSGLGYAVYGHAYSLVASDSTIFVSMQTAKFDFGVYRSTNNGLSWTELSGGLPVGRRVWGAGGGILLMNGTNVLFGTYEGLFLSIDEGESWSLASKGAMSPVDSMHGRFRGLAFAGTTLFAGTRDSGVYRSTDEGVSWERANTPFSGFTNMVSSGTRILVASDWGDVYLSTDGGSSWNAINNGLPPAIVADVAISGSNFYALTEGGLFLSTNDGLLWTSISESLPRHVIFTALTVSNDELVLGTNGLGVYRSTDAGSTWVNTSAGLIPLETLSLVAAGSNLFAGTARILEWDGGSDFNATGVYASDDGGTSWTLAGLTNTIDWPAGDGLVAIDLASMGDTVFAGTAGAGVLRTTDKGGHWTRVNTGLTPLLPDSTRFDWVHELAMEGSSLFALTWGGEVFATTDQGSHWTTSSGPTAGFARSVKFGTTAFAGTDSGLCRSTNNGDTWTRMNDAPPYERRMFIRVPSPVIFGTDLFLGTQSGVWRRPLAEMVVTSTGEHAYLPHAIALYQNFPNPFNPSTTISYDLPAPEATKGQAGLPAMSTVSLRVFDLLGREVAVLVNEVKPAGRYTATWNAAGFASGMYFCRLESGNYRETKKLMLLR